MKIKNLAFFGVMAAIMGVAGTARADTTTVIASQAYVDAKDALKQNLLKSGDGGNIVLAGDANGNVITGITADGQGTVTVTKGTLDLTGTINGLDLSAVSESGKPIVSVSQDNGQVAASVGTITTAGIADSAIATSINATGSTSNEKLATETAVRGALDAKQGNLGGTVDGVSTAGKVVTATNTAGDVTYTGIDTTVGANADNLVTSGAVATAIGNASTAVNNAFADNTLDSNGLSAADSLAKVASIHSTVARQGSLTKAWNEGFDSTAAETTNATNLYNATTNTETNANATPDNYVPTVAAVEKRVQSAINTAIQTAGNSAADTYQTKSDSYVASNGNYITAGQGVGANLVALDTRAKTNADDIATNAANITTLNSGANTQGSVSQKIQAEAESATFTPGDSGLTSTTLAAAIKEVKTTAASGLTALTSTDTATNQPVVAVNQNNGAVAPVRGTISYAQGLKYNLSNINTQGGDGSAACVQGSPCTLTMFMDNGNPVYEWTNMDTESTNAVM